MRTTRALFATFGVSAVLVAVGAFSLLALSAVVAIGGWPGLADSASGRAVVLADVMLPPGETAGGGPASGAVVLAAEEPEPRPGSGRDGRAEPASAEAVRPVQSPAAPSPASAPQLDPSSAPAASSDTPPGRDPEPKPDPRTGDVVRTLGDGLGNTVQGTGDALGDTTAQLSPELGEAVDGLTGILGGTLRDTGQLVGGAADLLLTPRR